MTQQFTIPGGPNKGVPVNQADEKTLAYWADRLGKSEDARDAPRAAAMRAELERRAKGGAPAPAAPKAAAPASSAMVTRTPVTALAGSFREGPRIQDVFAQAKLAGAHLVTPATAVGSLPEGCEVAVNVVHVDPYGADIYPLTGNRNDPRDTDTVLLGRVALAQIGRAAGVSWIVSRRTDDGSDAHYCAWEAVAEVRAFDGRKVQYTGNVELDTRERGGLVGADAQEIRKKAKDRPDKGDSQLLELRKFILRHAESKAKNRAIADMGVRRSWKRSELRSPFVVAAASFTGKSDDPAARALFQKAIADSFLGGASAAYGQLPTQRAPQLSPPPPINPAPARLAFDFEAEPVGEPVGQPVGEPSQPEASEPSGDTKPETEPDAKAATAPTKPATTKKLPKQPEPPPGAGDAWEHNPMNPKGFV